MGQISAEFFVLRAFRNPATQ